MITLWLATGVLAKAPAAAEQPIRGGDDAGRSRSSRRAVESRPVIYLWPERKEEALEAIEAVQEIAEPASSPASPSPEAVALQSLRVAIEQEATAAIIRARLEAAAVALQDMDRVIADAHRAALIEDMRQAAIAAAMAREQSDMEIAFAVAVLL